MESRINVRLILKKFGLLFAVLFLMAVLTGLSPHFMTVRNMLNLLLQASVNAIIAAGMTQVILTSGIDLSVGSVLALTAVVTASILQTGVPVPLAVILGLLLGALLGMVNGFLVAIVKIPAFIATLGTMTLARGLALSYSGGRPVTGLPEGFLAMGTSSLFGIPTPIWITAAVFVGGSFILNKTMLGRYIYAIGNNAEAARFAGLPVRATTISVYAISGLLAALAGMILVARLDSAQPVMGVTYELNAIAAVVVGGAALSGGEGSLSGTFLGAILMAIIANAINILNISPFFSQILQGGVILAALLLHGLSRQRER
ncbi:ABC transporter permease [Salinispira pacifica]|uniref:Ribose ABC transport system, permease protein RbsC n=1 Tax=Salinispira pacifica TaxID=1307761 RepID=V5WGJ6_9SPIO|nr:ribose ABC transporter permease [Salinispira pacifica]AHC14908.1 Ribose ABC transport system, permease protein RbsC [Salinispira pacifica]